MCGAWYQGLLSIFGRGGILEGFDDISKALRMASEGFIGDDAAIVNMVAAHKWNVLMAILDSDTRCCQMRARTLQGPPKVLRIVLLAPQTH